MANPRLVIAAVLAGIAFVLAVFGILGEIPAMTGVETGNILGHASLAASHFAGLSASHLPGLVALALSVAAFGIGWNRKSYLVAGLLFVTGVLYAIHLAPFLDHGAIAFPGPVVGLFIGHAIMALGVAKGIGSARRSLVQSPNK